MSTLLDMDWIKPSSFITTGLLFLAILLVPLSGYRSPPPVVDFVINWILVMFLFSSAFILARVLWMLANRVSAPVAELKAWGKENASRIGCVAIGFFLTGAIQLAFNWVKPQLAIIYPFWADPMLANLDVELFGAEPWPKFRGLFGNIEFFDWIYSLWYPVTLFTLFGALVLNRSRAIIAYFLLWGVFGPLAQIPFSSAGPIFWRRIGLGNRFDGIFDGLPFGSENAANYLWRNYTAQTNDIAVGISAMPSMHVAMSAWIALAYIRTPAAPLGLAYWACVWIGSVALGWHYAVDGLVGTAGTLLCWMVAGLKWPGRAKITEA